MRSILLVDNGSTRPASALSLRRLATALSARIGETVDSVSLRHADAIDPAQLGGVPAHTLGRYLRYQVSRGVREFVLLPLFFGRGAALTKRIPDTVAELREAKGEVRVKLANELYPLPAGEPRLVDLLCDHIRQLAATQTPPADRVILVDHGSPNPKVTAVRTHLAARLRDHLAGDFVISEAVMERREGPTYDFNGPLLADELSRMAQSGSVRAVGLAMLFLAPGRHAGPGGDIAHIGAAIRVRHPGFAVHTSPLVGEHPGLLDILAARLGEGGKAL